MNQARRQRGDTERRAWRVRRFGARGVRNGGFSLAELMIALALLGMGLLVIAAALPAGARYTRDSVDLATGAAAAEYALDLIEQSVYLRDTVVDANDTVLGARPLRWPPVLFQRRVQADDPNRGLRAGEADPDCEPVIKVRPLFVQNIIRTPGPLHGQELYQPGGSDYRIVVLTERAVANWVGLTEECYTEEPCYLLEYDLPNGHALSSLPAGPWLQPALPSVSLVYPPISADDQFYPEGFWDSQAPNWMYRSRPVNTPGAGSETRRALERRVTWTAFYRRVEYGPGSDPTLYEFIAVAVRLPSDRHRFPVQDPTCAGMASFSTATKSAYLGADTLAPIPWLVTFDAQNPNALPWPDNGFDEHGQPRFYGSPPATLSFHCTRDYSPLFPVGSVFIPARNDRLSDHAGQKTHFGPLTRTGWPIYEVVSRPDETTVVVKYNGYFPVANTPRSWERASAAQWPVWVTPPASEDVVGSGSSARPVFSNKSPILAVARRYIRLPNLRPR